MGIKLKTKNSDISLKAPIQTIKPITEEVNIKPTEEEQIITPSEDKYINKVTVEPIPSEYIKPSGTLDIYSNGEYDVKNYEKANVNVGGASKGIIINEWNSDGYPTDISIVGMTTIPNFYLYYGGYNGAWLSKTGLKLTISKETTIIGNSALYYCRGITKIIIESETLSIKSGAFRDTSLKTLVFTNIKKVPSVEKADAFYSTSLSTDGVYVPDNLVESFKVHESWSSRANYIKPLSEYVE